MLSSLSFSLVASFTWPTKHMEHVNIAVIHTENGIERRMKLKKKKKKKSDASWRFWKGDRIHYIAVSVEFLLGTF